MDKDMLLSQRNNGISWFYWITGLSLINTCINVFDGGYSFIVWLWYTQFLDAIVILFRDDGNRIAMTLVFFASLLVSGFFALSAYLTEHGKKWWYLIAMILYIIDMFVYLYVGDYVGIGFHIFALVYIYRGYVAHRQLFVE